MSSVFGRVGLVSLSMALVAVVGCSEGTGGPTDGPERVADDLGMELEGADLAAPSDLSMRSDLAKGDLAQTLVADGGSGPCAAFDVETVYHTVADMGPGGAAPAGYANALAVDPANGALHATFVSSGRLMYATNRTGAWVTTEIGAYQQAASTAIAIGAQGVVHIAFCEEAAFDLVYVTNASGSWVQTTVDSAGYVGEDPSIALDTAGHVHLAYLDGSKEDLKYATNATGSWVSEVVDANISGDIHASIRLTASGDVRIAYGYYAVGLLYATGHAGAWTSHISAEPGTDHGSWPSLGLDGAGAAHVSSMYHQVGGGSLRYATNASGTWGAVTVDDVGQPGYSSSLAVDAQGAVHISYLSSAAGELRYASNAGGAFTKMKVRNAYSIADTTSIVMDATNRPAIAFRADPTTFAVARCR